MKKYTLSLIALFLVLSLSAQKEITLTIQHKLGSNLFAFNQASQNDLSQPFKLTRVDYYLSGFTIIHDGAQETVVPAGKYILAKGDNNVVEILGTFNVTNVEGIKFHIGVEAPTNNNDPSVWLAPHPLAPQSPSMHWGWSAGYRFVALEGNAGNSFNTNFQMHGLGNPNYFEQTVMVAGVNQGDKIKINLDADYNEALKGININAGPIDHGVDATDLTVLQNFRDRVFKAGNGFSTSVNEVSFANAIKLFPNPSAGKIHIQMTNNLHPFNQASITDITGKSIQEINFLDQTEIDLNLNTKGLYFIRFSNSKGDSYVKKLIIE